MGVVLAHSVSFRLECQARLPKFTVPVISQAFDECALMALLKRMYERTSDKSSGRLLGRVCQLRLQVV